MTKHDVSTKDGAIAFYYSEEWRAMSAADRVRLQLGTKFCCMPWSVVGASLMEATGRFVFEAEMLDKKKLLAEIDARNPPETKA